MIRLRTLGRVQLEAPGRADASAVGSQPKRLALLIYLASSRPLGPHRRDNLLALFWPDSDQNKGRQVLRQTVYLLRQSLGAEVLVSQGDEDVEVDRRQVTCDATEFEQAITDGRLSEGLEIYGGDFLSGFHAPGVAPEFEDWIAAERSRLKDMACTAAWTLSSVDEQSGQVNGAIYWARRGVALDRDNEEGVRDLMLLLARVGDRPGALRAFDELVLRLREQELEPDAGLTQLAATIRAAARPARLNDVPAPAPAPLQADEAKALVARVVTGVPPAAAVVAPPRRRWRYLAASALVLTAAAVAFATLGRRRAAEHVPVLAVGAIMDVSAPGGSAESPVASDLLATSLARVNGLQVIPEVRLYDLQAQLRAVGSPSPSPLEAARYAGAVQLLRGTMSRKADGHLQLDAQLLELASGTVVRAFRVEARDLFELVDRATETMAQLQGAAPPPTSIADVTTRSLVAYRLYQEGLRAFYESNDLRSSQGLFRAALAEDSSFAMAAYYDGTMTNILSQPDAGARLQRAAQLASQAPDRERLLIRYHVAAQNQSPDAMALAETLSVRFPNDLDAMGAVAALRQRAGDWAAAARQLRDLTVRDSLSLRLRSRRCLACEAYVDLWWTYVYADSFAAAAAAMQEWRSRQGPTPTIRDLLSIALERQNRFAEARALWRDAPVADAALRVAMMAIRAGDYPAARDSLNRLLRSGLPDMRHEYRWWLSLAFRNEGRYRDARAIGLDDAFLRGILSFESGEFRASAAVFDQGAREVRTGNPIAWARRLPWQQTHLATALAAAGDTTRLSALADSAQRIGAGSFFGRDPLLHHYIRGLLWLARGDTARAAESFRASIWSWTDGYTRANLALANALLALGRPREAIYPLQAALRGDLQSSNLYVTRTELHEALGRAFAATGARDSASANYALVARAWEHADPAFTGRRAVAVAYLGRR